MTKGAGARENTGNTQQGSKGAKRGSSGESKERGRNNEDNKEEERGRNKEDKQEEARGRNQEDERGRNKEDRNEGIKEEESIMITEDSGVGMTMNEPIRRESTSRRALRLRGSMRIFDETFAGKTITLDIEASHITISVREVSQNDDGKQCIQESKTEDLITAMESGTEVARKPVAAPDNMCRLDSL